MGILFLGFLCGVGVVVENCIVDASIFWFLFVFKGVRWMPWYTEPMKDVVACDIPRGVGERAVIRGFPNGGTWLGLCPVTSI